MRLAAVGGVQTFIMCVAVPDGIICEAVAGMVRSGRTVVPFSHHATMPPWNVTMGSSWLKDPGAAGGWYAPWAALA